ncbi:MAG: DUF3179 domain-containing protein [Gemmatimonadetes bacterium]|nr:DUF3179 domain-containing protein [Gemmatimonadota bacterium]
MDGIWNVLLYCAGLGSILLIYLPFSPMTIDLILFSRETQIAIYRRRRILWAIGGVSFAVLLARGLLGAMVPSQWGPAAPLALWGERILGTADPAWLWIGGGTVAFLAVAFWSGYVPYVMTPPSRRRVLDARDADRFLDPEDAVLGLVHNGEARAYLRDHIARPHCLPDRVGGTHVTITYCILCNSGMAFKSELRGRPLELRALTAFNNNIIYHEPGRGNFIQQLDGRVIHGPDKGRALETLPVQVTTWEEWKRLHPDTTAMYSPALTLRDRLVEKMLEMMVPIPKLVRRSKPFHRLKGKLDERLPPMSYVLGVEQDGDRCAYPLSYLARWPVVNDIVGGQPIVVFYETKHDVGYVFSRRLVDRTLTFRAAQEPSPQRFAQDEETGTDWDVEGRARDGELRGRSLEPIPHYNKIFWFSWASFKPGTRVQAAVG